MDAYYKEIIDLYNKRRKQEYLLASFILNVIALVFLILLYFLSETEKKNKKIDKGSENSDSDNRTHCIEENKQAGNNEEMIKISEKLAKPFDFVRVDFYETKDGKLKFGELTFSPSAGGISFSPNNDEIQKHFGKLFKIPKRDSNGFAIHKKR